MRRPTKEAPIIELHKICMDFRQAVRRAAPVLEDIDMTLREGEIVGLLGRSGCGKVDPAAHRRRAHQRRLRAKCFIGARRSMVPPKASRWSFRPSPCSPG